MGHNITVLVEIDSVGSHFLRMTWEDAPNLSEIEHAFRKVRSFLNTTNNPVYIIVDITNDPQIPVHITLNQVSDEILTHELLEGWLVVGTNQNARLLGKLMSTQHAKSNISWFANEQSLCDYLSLREINAQLAS